METQETTTTQQDNMVVTSIADQEKQTGTKVDLPTLQEMAARSSAVFIPTMQAFMNAFDELGSKAKTRIIRNVLAIPDVEPDAQGTMKVPSDLKSKLEKQVFVLGQQLIMYRFIMTQQHIKERHDELKKKQESETTNGQQQEQSV